MCRNSVKETCFSQKYQKWIYQVLEMSSLIVDRHMTICPSYRNLLSNDYFAFIPGGQVYVLIVEKWDLCIFSVQN